MLVVCLVSVWQRNYAIIPRDKPKNPAVKQDVLCEALGFLSGPMAVSILLAAVVALQGD